MTVIQKKKDSSQNADIRKTSYCRLVNGKYICMASHAIQFESPTISHGRQ